MDKHRNYRGKGMLLTGLAFAILLCAGIFAGQNQTKQKSLGLFPVGLSDSVFSPEGMSMEDAGTKLVTDLFKSDKRFSCVPFSRSHPAIQRALSEGSISAALLLPPFTGKVAGEFKAVKLGKLMRVEVAVAPVVESYDFDSAKGIAKLVITYQVFDVKLAKMVGSVTLTATGTNKDEKAAALAALQQMASQGVPQVIDILTKPPKPGGL